MGEPIPINPEVLRWARETAGLSQHDVVRLLSRKRVDATIIQEWESGESTPTYAQLENLAYKIYKRPLAIFFFPEPPQEDTPAQSFRSLPDHELSRLPVRIRMLVRQAKVMQINLAELRADEDAPSRSIVRDLSFDRQVTGQEMSVAVRNYLGIGLGQQKEWKSVEEAFKNWRRALEDVGVNVFKDAFKENEFSGFCLYATHYPVIYVNNSMPDTRQVFTLFHELAHLLLGTGGVDFRTADYLSRLEGDFKQIEVSCNRFAGEFLVPSSDFFAELGSAEVTKNLIDEMASRYGVSREVILRKLLDNDIITHKYYDDRVRRWGKEGGKTGSGGNYYFNKGVYLGEKYIGLVFRNYYQNRISVDALASYLGVKVKNVPGIESLLLRRGRDRGLRI